jgi:hypothetical protein
MNYCNNNKRELNIKYNNKNELYGLNYWFYRQEGREDWT